ncbi:hypothetical protein EBR96_01995, partial [bacterium]|nr:hypothetical protein [bacterium]
DFPGLFEVVKRAIRQCLQDEALSLGPDEAKQVISYINDLFEEVIGEPLLNDNETNTLLDQIAQLNWDADPENPDGLRGIASDQDTLVRTDSDPEFGFGVGVDGLENAEAASASGGIRVKALDVSSFFASGVAALSGGNRVERGQSASGDTSQDRNEQQRKVEKVVRILEKLAEEGIDRALQGVGDKLNKVGLGDLLSRSSGSSVDSELF